MLYRQDGWQASDNPTPEEPGLRVLDRSVGNLTGILLLPFIGYVRVDLGHDTDRGYLPLNLEVNGACSRDETVGRPEDAGTSFAQSPDLKVLAVHGT